MYIVVAKWGVLPQFAAEAEVSARNIREILRKQPGVLDVRGFKNEDGVLVAVISYESEEAYDRVIHDPEGPFLKAAEANHLFEYGVWVGSDRGHSLE